MYQGYLHYLVGYAFRRTKVGMTLDEGEEENENAGLKLNIQKTKIMASSLITS